MSEFAFYHFDGMDVASATISLLEKIAVAKGNKVLFCLNDNQIAEWDNILWTKKQLSFIPHNLLGEDLNNTKVLLTTKCHCDDFNYDVTLSINPIKIANNKSSIGKNIYIIDPNHILAFKTLFEELQKEGNNCKYHLLKNGKWVSTDQMSVA